ncbi:MAG: hypothetical protein ACTHNP_02400 [Solirubrobacterales bacterium]
MSQLPTYSFLPWYRRGIANTITAADKDPSAGPRVSTHVELELSGTPVAGGEALSKKIEQDIALYGPGDLVGIDGRAILRTEPRNWITNFESNYLPAVDFYDEDFLWRYTPAAPDGSHLKLRPWLTLVVLAEGEFEDGKDATGRPLPYITVADQSLFPPADDLWAWAHVHLNQSVAGSAGEVVTTDPATVAERAETILAQNPDAGYARLLCPRRLADETAYHAFLVPTFETGRLAGIGKDPADAPFATASAWADYPSGAPKPRQQGSEYPYYFRWYFRTGDHGDFLYLVRLLQPKPVDPRVGVRDMDVREPGSNVPGILNLEGVLRLGGALQVPKEDLDEEQLEERQRFEDWDQPFPHVFQSGLAAFVNLPDDYATQEAEEANAKTGLGPEVEENPDPLITAPLYGKWHSLTQRLLSERDGTPVPNPQGWPQRLNLDPRFRVPAGFGADVVESNAEQYMNYAWQQIGDVLEANALIRRFHLATAVSSRWYDFHLAPLATARPERTLTLSAPVQAKILGSPTTVEHLRKQSRVPPVLTSPAFRRVVRPQGRLIRRLPFTAAATPGNLLERVNAGEVTAAPPKTVPGGVLTVDEVAGVAQPKDVPSGIATLLARYPWLPWLLIVQALVLLIVLALVLSLVVGIVVFLLCAGLALLLRRWQAEEAPAAGIGEGDQTPAAVEALPDNPGFQLSEPGAGTGTPTGGSDSATAIRLKEALGDSFTLIAASREVGRQPEPRPLDLVGVNETVVAALDPRATLRQRAQALIDLPAWIAEPLVEDFGEVMAYPRIDLPMYEPLKTRSIELFLPNINLIEPNSITLVETNQRFIEAYMVGLNHELARKLLWREFPTDQRGSYFRQFWDVRSVINVEGLSEDALREALYDIPELHRWPPASALGSHNNRETTVEQGEDREQAVLVVRGELLKKYPTAVIYAQRAEWELEKDGTTPDLAKPRKLVPIEASEEEKPSPAKLRPPLYEAKADPDIYFFGFDLTIKEAMGGTGRPPDTDPGWFFVIKERPGEPRFGLELERDAAPEVLDELTWDDAMSGGGEFLPAGSLASFPLAAVAAGDPEGKGPQHTDDEAALGAAASSARWAYLLFRPPVMVAIHADEMLRRRS